MTRFARYGEKRKKPEDSTDWKEMKHTGDTAANSVTNPVIDKTSSMSKQTDKDLRGVKHDKKFKSGKNGNKLKKKVNKKNAFGIKKVADYSTLECYNCKQKGHKASDCQEPSDGKNMEFECYNCKQKGHKAFQCPKPNKRDKRQNQQKKHKDHMGQKVRQGFQKFNKSDKNWKEQRSEQRRLKRQTDAEAKKHCFHCREAGHQMSECPDMQKDVEQGTGICFKCGSTEHSINKCTVKLAPGEFPYAKCFICGETGHLSRQCPDNPRGLYPNGGCCNECGSVEHLKRDCPDFQKKQGISSITLGRLTDDKSVELVEVDEKQNTKDKKKTKGTKIVKF